MKRVALVLVIALVGCAKRPAPVSLLAPVPHDTASPLAFDSAPVGHDVSDMRTSPHFKPIYFGFDQRAPLPTEAERLHDILTRAAGHCSIAGYTDGVGDAAYNLALGHARAQAVQTYLQTGRSPATLSTTSYGAEHPASPTDDALNRRVEVECE